jgi:ABC-2 type transport system ATP-binding protein
VLDGTLEEIQSAYGYDTVVVRAAGGADVLRRLPGVEAMNDRGNQQEVRLSGSPQAFLRELVAATEVSHFELVRPSLHDIFVRIARPGGAGTSLGQEPRPSDLSPPPAGSERERS